METKENERPWGKYETIEKTKIITVKPNQKLSLQFHNKRDEFWRILSGSGRVYVGEKSWDVKAGDEAIIPKKTQHRVESYDDGLVFLEIATGEVYEDDIVRIEDDYGRLDKS